MTRYCGLVCVAILFVFTACSSGGSGSRLSMLPHDARFMTASSPVAPPGYSVSVFVRGTSQWFKPDAIVAQSGYTFVAYQNATTATSDGGDSTIVQYKAGGRPVRVVQVAGRCDGVRFDPYTHVMWITVNEDGNSSLYTGNFLTGQLKHYHFSSAAHGGGYDDLAFANGKAFIAASNPTLNSSGINTGPALVSVTLSGTTALVRPVLFGNQTARDISTAQR